MLADLGGHQELSYGNDEKIFVIDYDAWGVDRQIGQVDRYLSEHTWQAVWLAIIDEWEQTLLLPASKDYQTVSIYLRSLGDGDAVGPVDYSLSEWQWRTVDQHDNTTADNILAIVVMFLALFL